MDFNKIDSEKNAEYWKRKYEYILNVFCDGQSVRDIQAFTGISQEEAEKVYQLWLEYLKECK